MGARMRRFENESGRNYESPTRCTGRKRFRFALLEADEKGYYGDDEENLRDDLVWRSDHKKRKLEMMANETKKESAADYPDEKDMKLESLIWLHTNDMESCGSTSELKVMNMESKGQIESGHKVLKEFCTAPISMVNSAYIDFYAGVDVGWLYDLDQSPLHDEIVMPLPEGNSKRPSSPIPYLVELNREDDQGGIEFDYKTLEEISTSEVDAIFDEWLSKLANPLQDEIVTVQTEIKSE